MDVFELDTTGWDACAVEAYDEARRIAEVEEILARAGLLRGSLR